MRIEQALSYPVSIFMAGDYDLALRVCRSYCDEIGLCVTVTPTTYVYTGGSEVGFLVGLINYPRFPTDPHDIIDKAGALADRLREGLGQASYSIQTPERTIWRSWRAADCDSDGTATAAACEDMPVPQDCQARAESIAPNSAGDQ